MRTKKEISRRIGRVVCGLALACLTTLASTAFAAGSPRHEIHLLGRSWTPAAGVPQETDRALAAQAQAAREKGQTRIHALVQLHEIPDESQRNELSRDGIELGAYVPGTAWIAAIPVGRAAAVGRLPGVRSIEPWTASHKLHPRLAAGEFPSWSLDPGQPGWIAVMVLLHGDVDLGRGPALAELAGGSAGAPVEGLHGIPMWIPAASLATLAAEEEVLWIEQGPPPLSETNEGIRTQMKVNAVNSSPYGLDGQGARLLIFDTGTVSASHESFNAGPAGRVTVIDGSGSTPNPHSTHVAGTAAGDGSGSPAGNGRGVAPAAKILSAAYAPYMSIPFYDEYGDLETDYGTARNSYAADLASNSIGFNLAEKFTSEPCWREGDYGLGSALIDQIVHGTNPVVTGPMITVWSAGNERDGAENHGRCGASFRTTSAPACAKNPIHVGAINSDGSSMTRFSSWGPCDDGRLKPTVVAPGCETGRVTGEDFILSATCSSAEVFLPGSSCAEISFYAGYCGTSMAAPAVSGTIALLLQDWREHLTFWFPNIPNARLLPALVKAALIQTSRDLGPDGPDYRYGYGAVDAQALIDFERAAGSGGPGGLGGPGLKVWGTEYIDNGETDSFNLTVPTGIAELKASLAWDDPAGQSFAGVELVNDLDLELVAPNGMVYRPFILDPANPHLAAVAGANHLDNQEQVLVKNPQAGIWKVRVLGTGVPEGPQSYGLAYGATPVLYSSSCGETFTSFESVIDYWTMTGAAARVAAPAPGHGAWSARLGGINDDVSEVKRQIALPAHQKSTLSFDLYMTTDEGADNWGYDEFSVEVRATNGNVLSVLSFHNDGDAEGAWLPERNIDLTPWGGQTVYLVFRVVTTPSYFTAFWVDDVRVTSCPSASPAIVKLATFNSNGAQDGHVIESSQTGNAGGTAVSNNFTSFGASTFLVGDNSSNQQIKGFVSFDTSGLPDNAILVSARLVLYRSYLLGTNPFTTHGACRVDVKTGGFSNNLALELTDFQNTPTGELVSILSNPADNGTSSYATLNGKGLAGINRTGTTQLRLYFEKGDDNDSTGDAILFIAGEDANASLQPRLEVKYMVP
ncbi:MAG: hypothetical protein QOH06_5793 [Acidobacteriota bacterium]|nr:hypothetical protein [Acidobacteriota bacterium]